MPGDDGREGMPPKNLNSETRAATSGKVAISVKRRNSRQGLSCMAAFRFRPSSVSYPAL